MKAFVIGFKVLFLGDFSSRSLEFFQVSISQSCEVLNTMILYLSFFYQFDFYLLMFDVVMVVFQATITYHLHRHMNPHHNQPLNSISHSKFKSILI